MAKSDRILDLAELSTRAEGLRGSTNRQAIKILGNRAVTFGFSGVDFRRQMRKNFSNLQWNTTPTNGSAMGWKVGIGIYTDGFNYLPRDKNIVAAKVKWAELQLTGYLSRLEQVGITIVTSDEDLDQRVHGTYKGMGTDLLVRQNASDVVALGQGPMFIVPLQNEAGEIAVQNL